MAQYDRVIRNGTIIDGTGLPRFNGDLAIKNGRVAKIGKIDASEAAEVLDADGMIVAPGFVDLHTHFRYRFRHSPEQLDTFVELMDRNKQDAPAWLAA